jgi:hypothetical protein
MDQNGIASQGLCETALLEPTAFGGPQRPAGGNGLRVRRCSFGDGPRLVER